MISGIALVLDPKSPKFEILYTILETFLKDREASPDQDPTSRREVRIIRFLKNKAMSVRDGQTTAMQIDPVLEAKQHADHVREHGITQLLHTWDRLKDRFGDELLWGDEVRGSQPVTTQILSQKLQRSSTSSSRSTVRTRTLSSHFVSPKSCPSWLRRCRGATVHHRARCLSSFCKPSANMSSDCRLARSIPFFIQSTGGTWLNPRLAHRTRVHSLICSLLSGICATGTTTRLGLILAPSVPNKGFPALC